MQKVGIFYGSTTGNTEEVALMISSKFDNASLHNISEVSTEDFDKYDLIIMGTSTWGDGELQDDWINFEDNLLDIKIDEKKIAYFGLGDQETYPESFIDGIGTIHEKLQGKNFYHIGKWDTYGYDYEISKALEDGKFLGLAIDIENQNELTEERVAKWVDQIKKEAGILN